MRRAGGAVLAASLFLAAASSLAAQVEDKPFLEEERRRLMDERRRAQEELRQPLLWDAGGWLHSEFIHLDDPPDKTERTLRYEDLRLWAEVRIERRWTAYVRLQAEYTDFNSGDQFEGNDDNKSRLHVDQAWLEADFSTDGEGLTVKLGKEFLSLGRGLLLNDVYYALQGSWSSGAWGARAFAAHTVLHEDDIDTSLPNSDDSRRAFAGLEVNGILSGSHRAYLVGLVERDLNEEDPDFATVDWGYDAWYAGAGARGTVAGGLGYQLEGIFESGKGVAGGSTQEETIRSFALLAALDYGFGGPLSPYLSAEYLFGTGDPDRGSVTDGAAGNMPGTDDEGFLAFGYVQTGFSLFPRLSNIHIVRAGGSIRPLASLEAARSLEVGGYFYWYRKDEADAPISDPRSFLADEDVGTEVDFFLRWRILSDVGISVNFGRFMPGAAYQDDDPRNFASAGLTYSF